MDIYPLCILRKKTLAIPTKPLCVPPWPHLHVFPSENYDPLLLSTFLYSFSTYIGFLQHHMICCGLFYAFGRWNNSEFKKVNGTCMDAWSQGMCDCHAFVFTALWCTLECTAVHPSSDERVGCFLLFKHAFANILGQVSWNTICKSFLGHCF